MRTSLNALILFVFCIILASCKTNSVSPSAMTADLPVIANTINAYTFSFEANNSSSTYSNDLTFTSDSIMIPYTITSSNYKSGSVSLSIVNSGGAIILKDSLFMNEVITGLIIGNVPPKQCTITYYSYTGDLTFAIGKHVDTLTVEIVFPASGVSYSKQVQPLFNAACNYSGCHNAANVAGGLNLSSWNSIIHFTPPVVLPQDSAHSMLILRIEGKLPSIMPPTGLATLNQNQIQGLKTWIMEGAKNN